MNFPDHHDNEDCDCPEDEATEIIQWRFIIALAAAITAACLIAGFI